MPKRDWTVLTEIERDVLRLRCKGYRHKEIARMLYLEYQSVKNISSRAYKILGIHNACYSRNLPEVKHLDLF